MLLSLRAVESRPSPVSCEVVPTFPGGAAAVVEVRYYGASVGRRENGASDGRREEGRTVIFLTFSLTPLTLRLAQVSDYERDGEDSDPRN